MKNNSERVLVCFQLSSFLSEAVNSIIPDRGLTQSSEPEYGHLSGKLSIFLRGYYERRGRMEQQCKGLQTKQPSLKHQLCYVCTTTYHYFSSSVSLMASILGSPQKCPVCTVRQWPLNAFATGNGVITSQWVDDEQQQQQQNTLCFAAGCCCFFALYVQTLYASVGGLSQASVEGGLGEAILCLGGQRRG